MASQLFVPKQTFFLIGTMQFTIVDGALKFRAARCLLLQGKFPKINLGLDGHVGLAPVDAFPAQNSFGTGLPHCI